MQQILMSSEMRAIDSNTINGDLDIGFKLMYEAADGLAGEIIKSIKGDVRKPVAFVCGKGNNGGDGFLAASILNKNGFIASCFSLFKKDDIKGEVLLAFEEYSKNSEVYYISELKDLDCLQDYYLIVDALLGTGVKGAPRGIIADVIKKINLIQKSVVAVDTPSGIDNDTGYVHEPCIEASKTVTMGFPKIGQYYYPAKDFIGELVVVKLSYPEDIIEKQADHKFEVNNYNVKSMIPIRKKSGSKYDQGVVGVIAGSEGMTGAPALAMNSALRAGCGMVYGIIPRNVLNIVSIKTTEPVLCPVENSTEGSIALDQFKNIIKRLNRANATLLGPGLSTTDETQALIQQLVENLDMPVVLDADGLNAYKDNIEKLIKHKSDLIITPHKGEFERLFGVLPEKPIEIFDLCKSIAEKYNLIIILKGKPSIISTSTQNFVVDIGDDSLATAGTGDVLAGIITSLIAQGATMLDAALAGVYIHGLAGRIASEKMSRYSVIASDVCNNIGMAYKEILNIME